MIKTGLTGNIGSGKSTVARIFEILGVPVYHADDAGRKLLYQVDVLEEVVKLFGAGVLDGKEIDRKKLAAIVFEDDSALEGLNAIIHPRVRYDLECWLDKQKSFPYIVQEAAILIESGFYKSFDKIILVSCPEEIAIKRVLKRDGSKREEVQSRISKQWPESKKLPLADFIIRNDGSELVIPQVLRIHNEIMNL